MSYNETSFANDPEKANSPGILYVVVLVNRYTHERECCKIGIAKGNSWKDAVKRARGFKGYELRIQKVVSGTLLEMYRLEQELHKEWEDYSVIPKQDFGGKTECFSLDILSNVLKQLRKYSPK